MTNHIDVTHWAKTWHFPTNIEFELEGIWSVQVIFQLNLDYCTKVVTYRGFPRYHTEKIKCNFTTLQSVYSCLSVYRHNVTPTFMTAVFPVLAKFWVDASTDLALKERVWWHSFDSSGFLKFRSCMHSWELITNLCTKKCNVSSS